MADESDPAGNPIQQTTDYAYDGDGHVLRMTAVMPGGTPSQTTQYIYGVGVNVGDLFSNDLLARIEYPDLSTGQASSSGSNDVTYTYDNLGETASKTDQNGTPHLYTYDVLGRLTLDAVHSLGGTTDGSVLALGYSYNRQGLPYQQTSYSIDPTLGYGSPIVNQDQDQYNGFGQLTAEYQSMSGPVDTSPGGTPEVQYGYSSALLGSRLTSMTYPNGRVIYYGYDGNALDNALGRVDYLADSDGRHLVDYTYLGMSAIVGQTDGDGVTETTTLDQFGRIAEMNYVNTTTHASTDDFAYGYDADGNVLSETNGVNSAFSQTFTYDSLNRLTSYVGGLTSQSWSLDAVGNQKSVTTNGTTTTNSQNSQNELTGVGSSTLSYDNNGNTTTDANGHTYIYDAWNRLISVTNSSNIVLASYTYDADGRRITETNPTIGSGQRTALYFTAAGQVIEERQAGAVAAQNVFGIDYVNSLLLRDTFSTTNGVTRLYDQHDLTFNVTALVDANGNVAQRMIYTPYGQQTVLNPTTWSVIVGTPNTVYGPQGGRCDLATGLVHFGARDLNPETGTWMTPDPAGYVDGLNMYRFGASAPVQFIDPTGMWVIMTFDYQSGTLTAVDAQTGQQIVISSVFSGNYTDANNPASQWKQDHGPIPVGTYYVGTPVDVAAQHPDHPNGDYTWYPLYGKNGWGHYRTNGIPVTGPDGKTYERGSMFLHTGRASDGCVTIRSEEAPFDASDSTKPNPKYPHNSKWDQLKNMLDKTQPYADGYVGQLTVRPTAPNLGQGPSTQPTGPLPIAGKKPPAGKS